MCFSVQVEINLKKLALDYGARLSPKFESPHFKAQPSGFMKTDVLPVLMSHEGLLRVEPMNWSLTPSWANEYPLKWNTYNARMERIYQGSPQRIYEGPTFRDAFNSNKFCLVPIKSAIEACYWGEPAGKIISFHEENNTNFMVAGLYDSWVDPKTGEIKNTCTLLTDVPYRYLFDHGHDRSIIVIDKDKQLEMIQDKTRSPIESFELIKNSRVDQNWSYEVIREVSKSSIAKNTPTAEELREIKATVWQN